MKFRHRAFLKVSALVFVRYGDPKNPTAIAAPPTATSVPPTALSIMAGIASFVVADEGPTYEVEVDGVTKVLTLGMRSSARDTAQ